MDGSTYKVVNGLIMQPAGFTYSAGAWTKQLTAPEFAALVSADAQLAHTKGSPVR